jgi:hypothetical protein
MLCSSDKCKRCARAIQLARRITSVCAMACDMHDVADMRHDNLVLLFIVLAAAAGPAALHFYHKSQSLQVSLDTTQERLSECAVPPLVLR